MPFLGHNPYDGLDVSPDKTPPLSLLPTDPVTRARSTVSRYALDEHDETMLLDLLGLVDAE